MWDLLDAVATAANLITFAWVVWRESNILFDPRRTPSRTRARAMIRVILVALPVWTCVLLLLLVQRRPVKQDVTRGQPRRSDRAGSAAYAYDDAGQPSAVAYPNTIASAYTIDRAGRVATSPTHALAALSPPSATPSTGEGQRLSRSSPQGTTGYTDDALGRLTGTTYPDTPAETFGYDAVGNRTSRTSSGATTTYAYDDANELASTTTAGSTSTYAYDRTATAPAWSFRQRRIRARRPFRPTLPRALPPGTR